ncbi:MAG: STAS domain-containing protein [Lachnospiraceae bacterium]|nr:STAS domain-containing protein [Lachnospiraceae bacterium]
MTIDKTLDGTKLEIALEGRLDTMTAPQLEEEVKNNIEGIKELIFDLKNLAYVSSAGLRVLLSAQKIMNKQGSMTIRNANEEVMEIFEVTGFIDILNIEE